MSNLSLIVEQKLLTGVPSRDVRTPFSFPIPTCELAYRPSAGPALTGKQWPFYTTLAGLLAYDVASTVTF